MFGSTVLEVAIGLALLFTLLSLVVTSAREALEALLQTRAIHLERGIRELLQDEKGDLAKEIYSHPYISNLFRGKYNPGEQLKAANWLIKRFNSQRKKLDTWKRLKFRTNLPAYIPSSNFALALLDTVFRGAPGDADKNAAPPTFDELRKKVADFANKDVRRALLIALDDSDGDIATARQNVEKWFDSSMDRVSGWYKKQTQWILLGLGLALAILLNVDTLRIASALYQNDSLRSVIVNEAEGVTQRQNTATATRQDPNLEKFGCTSGAASGTGVDATRSATECAQRQLSSLGYPIGWSGYRPATLHELSKDAKRRILDFPWSSIPGWLLTAFALSLGAPFWFDLLNKMMVVRSTVKPDEKSPAEGTKDKPKVKKEDGPAEGAQPPTR